jgi:hypothetical protein
MDFARLAVTITRLVDDSFPGWVECLLLDAAGNQHWFTEKVPVVSDGCAGPDDVYPRPGLLRCVVIQDAGDGHGHRLVEVSTDQPDGVELQTGQSRFMVHAQQVERP